MCILFFIADGNPIPGGYKLILASNRDEFYSRPAVPAQSWEENPFIFGGRDMQKGSEGGTWLAMSAKGGVIKVGALLNITGEPRRSTAVSGRGPIVTNYVADYLSNVAYTQRLVDNDDMYNAFNFVSVEFSNKQSTIVHCSNAPTVLTQWPQRKVLGFGNTPTVQPLKKVTYGIDRFTSIIDNYDENKNSLMTKLMDLLKCRDKHWPDEELKRRAPTYGEHLSSIYVKMPEAGYGTRTHTILLIDSANKLDYYEETLLTPIIPVTDTTGNNNNNNNNYIDDNLWKKTHISRQL